MSSLPPRVTSISIATAFHDRRSAATRVRVACVGSGRMSGNGQGLGRTGKAPEERFAKHGLEVRPRVRAWKRSSVCQSEPTPRGLLFETKKKTRRCVPTNHTQAVFCFACRLWELLTSGASSSASMTNLASLFSDSEISRSLQLGLYRTFRQNRSIRAATAVGRQGPRRLRLTFSSFPHFGSKFFHRNQPEYIPATLSQQQKFVHVFVHVHRLVLHRALVYARSSLRVHIACASHPPGLGATHAGVSVVTPRRHL